MSELAEDKVVAVNAHGVSLSRLACAPAMSCDTLVRMRCQRCGDRPAVNVTLQHNVGMLVLRHTESTVGRLCRSCLGSSFAHHQLRNLVFGWWGIISFCLTWYYLMSNVVSYIVARSELRGERRRSHASSDVDQANAQRMLLAFDVSVLRRLDEGDTSGEIIDDLVEATGAPRKLVEAFVADTQAQELG